MFVSPDSASELGELLAALHEDTITPQQAERLVSLLRDDAQARRTYIHRMVLVAGLHDAAGQGPGARSQEVGIGGRNPERIAENETRQAAPQSAFCLSDLSTSNQSSSVALHACPLSAWLSYAVAAMILAVGMLAAWGWRTPERSEQAAVSMPTISPIAAETPKKVPAGRITRIVDCRWTDANGPKDAVAGKIVLDRGLMEITYQSGAKVIIEGPVTYYVDSDNGGALERGKLTVCLDGPDARPRQSGTKGRDTGALVDLSPFSVRLPSGMATVLTGEFKVSVGSDNISHMTVSRGAVELLYPGDSPWISDTITSPGQAASAYVVRGDKKYPHRLVWRAGPMPEMVQSIIRSEPRAERLGGQPLNFEAWPGRTRGQDVLPATGVP